MNYRMASFSDIEVIKEILNANHLPYIDCHEHIENFFVAEINGLIIGVGGFENLNSLGLLRSIAVKSEYQNRGIAKQIYSLIDSKAQSLGFESLFLLTESAVGYFESFGYKIIERAEVPLQIKQTKQFKDLCPSSSMVMFKQINKLC